MPPTKTGGEDCPPVPDKSNGYVWPLYESFELYTANKDGSDRKQLTDNGFYDAEATVSPKGDKIVFTSTRDGDIDLYTMDIDGSNITRVLMIWVMTEELSSRRMAKNSYFGLPDPRPRKNKRSISVC